MLTNLRIRDFLLIKAADVHFPQGFTAITGETGAGKSMLMQAISFICGAKLSKDIIRPGAEKAVVSCTFEGPLSAAMRTHLEELDIDVEDALTLRRSLDEAGKSKSFINDVPVTQQTVKALAPFLFHIHGQFDNLFEPGTQLDLLDNFANLEAEAHDVATAYAKWKQKKSALEELIATQEALRNQRDYLAHVVNELDEASPQPNEETELLEKRQVIMNRARLQESFHKVEQLISGEDGAYDRINDLVRQVGKLCDSLPDLGEHLDDLNAAGDALGRVEASITRLIRGNDEDTDIESLDERLGLIRDLARKHRVSGDQLHETHAKLANDLNTLAQGETRETELRKEVSEAHSTFQHLATALHEKRVDAAKHMRTALLEELPPLKLEKVDFEVALETLSESQANSRGITKSTFMVRTNPGLPFGKLNEIASGGELSRFMLALRVILRQDENSQILIFDEIDAGTGGAVASAIGKRLKRLSKDQQVLTITHAPQVVAYADCHLCLHKTHAEEQTETQVIHLAEQRERITEMARMLSGDHITETATQAATELLDKAG